jgi:phenylpropionate dioxygenase-like ring-hydroxylating dioxygenase large terminal subunit
MRTQKFNNSEIPFGTLQRFGLTQEMIEDLPQHVLEEIYNGRRSPVLPIYIVDEKGNEIKARTRFAFVRLDDGEADVLFYPQLKKNELNRFSPEERKALEANQAIIAEAVMPDGKHVQSFHQLDPGTNQILYVPTPVIGRNLEIISKAMKLTNAELICLQKGLPISVLDNDEMHTVGIDLTEKTGIRVTQGDERKWREEQKRGGAKYNFGINGCWMMDDEGNLDYVPEESYTEELWEEMKKRNNTTLKHK